MIVWVVWSRATRAPTTNFVLSSLTFTPTTFLVPEDDLTISTIFILFTFFFSDFFKHFSNDLSNRLQ